MASDVDELDINPFFKALQTKFSELYNKAQEKCYTICIPQTNSVLVSAINKDFADTHILKPSPYFKGELLTSHSGSSSSVSIDEDGRCITTGEGFPSLVKARIISEELAYNKEYKQYRILILDQPLHPKFQSKRSDNGLSGKHQLSGRCVTLQECVQFLQSYPEMSKGLEKVDQSVRQFTTNYMVLPDYLHDAAARLQDISTDGVQMCLKCVGRKQTSDVQWRDTLTVAMESYVMCGAQGKVMGVVSQVCASDDSSVKNKREQQLRDINAEGLGIQKRFVCPLPQAVTELNKLSALTTPREKLHCLKSVIDAVFEAIAAHQSRDIPPHLALTAEKPCLASDDLIPILVYVIGQSESSHLQSDIVYMETFAWASTAQDMDDLSYCLVTFKAAVQYILDTDFSHLPHMDSNARRQTNIDHLSTSAERLSISNGDRSCRGDNAASLRHSPTPVTSTTVTGGDRLDRQRSRVSKALEEAPRYDVKEIKEPKVHSIFGDQYDVSVASQPAPKSQAAPQLGDFLSSLQDDFLDQPFGKQS